MTEIHDQRTIEQLDAARTLTPVPGCRQGDIVLRPLAKSPESGSPTPPTGYMIQFGRHGQHRLIAPSYRRTGDEIHLAAGGLLIHTDKPEARHGAFQLCPGTYQLTTGRELGAGDIIKQVQD